ncbi:hypothetical protein FEM48_Zijuj11G0121300 [Ziziphus jujuba var. spinosa]|uniref:LysM domain-containing protein n=1 Tax=Ziziphus jujuba var. spinosa TaxID=714518 RepID=A0A978UIU7_ZIZJJ|nr:hypothetical protein FEM48_Zijuj11G0121300 [Ziziphus jujuba var. spinosa]
MAKFNNKISMLLNLLLLLSVVLMISTAESRKLGRNYNPNYWLMHAVGFKVKDASLQCLQVYAVEAGDTCSLIVEKINTTFDSFLAINPNINCDSIFVGQWVCTEAEVN